jgi:uncharacterized protein HemY
MRRVRRKKVSENNVLIKIKIIKYKMTTIIIIIIIILIIIIITQYFEKIRQVLGLPVTHRISYN